LQVLADLKLEMKKLFFDVFNEYSRELFILEKLVLKVLDLLLIGKS
jgi:hypothetical protein